MLSSNDTRENMSKYAVVLLLISLFFRADPVYSIFGVEGVPLEDYYEFGKYQTGVASTRIAKQGKTGIGTANLIDVKDIGIPSLKGRLGSLEGKVLITAAHVISDGDFEASSVRFMNENNESQTVAVQDFICPDRWRDKDQDIGFIILKEAVDVSKFKPLKLNLTTEDKSFSGKAVSIFGCTPVFGKVNSSVVIRESTDTLLRRGMTTVLDDCTNNISELIGVLYGSKGVISIFRDSTRALTDSDREKKHKIEEELEHFDTLINTTQSAADKLTLIGRRYDLSRELSKLHTIEVRKMLFKKIFYNGENIQGQLYEFEDTKDLDKSRLISEWESFINTESSGTKSIDIGAYRVKFYGSSPRLNGLTYHGDSGGAWVIDDEIVGLSKGIFKFNRKKFQVKKIESLSPILSGTPEYFTECEKIISQPQSQVVDNEIFKSHFATSIWSCRDWIESTLEEIARSVEASSLEISLPASSGCY